MFEFSCGTRLVRKLSVDVGSEADFIRITRLREKLNVSRWTDANAVIVRRDCSNDVVNTHTKEPANISSLNTLKYRNYVRQMHLFLDVEEARRNELLTKYVLNVLRFPHYVVDFYCVSARFENH